MRYLPVLLALLLLFTACSLHDLKHMMKKPSTSTTPYSGQPATPPIAPTATTTPTTGAASSQSNAKTVNPSGVKLTINALDGIRGEVGKTYRFTAQTQGIPLQATYTYYVNDSQLGSGNCDYIASFVPTAVPVDPYIIKVTAQWTTSAGMQTASDSVQFIAEGKPLPGSQNIPLPYTKHLPSPTGSAALSLYIPSGADGPDGSYTFVAQPQNIPASAFYNWYINGYTYAGGTDKRTLHVPAGFFTGGGQYGIRVVASWYSSSGAPCSATADGIFNCYR